jgi:hypothetical protein
MLPADVVAFQSLAAGMYEIARGAQLSESKVGCFQCLWSTTRLSGTPTLTEIHEFIYKCCPSAQPDRFELLTTTDGGSATIFVSDDSRRPPLTVHITSSRGGSNGGGKISRRRIAVILASGGHAEPVSAGEWFAAVQEGDPFGPLLPMGEFGDSGDSDDSDDSGDDSGDSEGRSGTTAAAAASAANQSASKPWSRIRPARQCQALPRVLFAAREAHRAAQAPPGDAADDAVTPPFGAPRPRDLPEAVSGEYILGFARGLVL